MAGLGTTAAYAQSLTPAVTVPNSITTVAGNGLKGSTGDDGVAVNAELDRPGGVAESLSGTIYVADTGNNKVRQIVNPTLINEDTISTVAGTSRGFSGDGHLAIHAKLDDPKAVAVDARGDIFIADTGNNRVREVLANGVIKTVAGNGSCTSAASDGNGKVAVKASLCSPAGVAVGPSGELYISDTGHREVRVVGSNGVIKDFAGDGVLGSNGDGGQATKAEIAQPEGLAVIAVGRVLIADEGAVIITHPHGRHSTPDVRQLGSDVRVVSRGVIETFAGTGRFGYSGDGGRATRAELNGPTGVGVDHLGDIFISDTGNNRIREVDASGKISTFAGTGRVGFSGDGGPATKAKLDQPTGSIATDSDAVYFADLGNQRIRGVFSGPPPVLPQAPWSLALPLIVIVIGAGGLWFHRRRRAAAATAVS
jgi:NHL repeat